MLDGAAQAVTGEDQDNPEKKGLPQLFFFIGRKDMEEKEIIVKRSSMASLLLGFLIGGLVGATVVLLSAPQSGADTRAMISNKTGELKDRAVDVVNDTTTRAKKAVSSARGQASDIAQATKDGVSDVVQQGKQAVQKS